MAAKSKEPGRKVGLAVIVCDEEDDEPSMDRPRRRFCPLPANAANNKESCDVCFEEDIDSDLMFQVVKCGHRFCFDCVKKHIKVKLLDGAIPDCLQYCCDSKLSIDRCRKLLTPKLSLMWRQMIKEKSTPLSKRVYCADPNCAYLMSKTELSSSDESGLRRCFECNGSFCLNCKVPWHSSLSCYDYNKLHSTPRNDNDDDDDAKLKSLANSQGWRQCGKCHHMVERSDGCNRITCRCGIDFCYKCGNELNNRFHCIYCYPTGRC